MSSGNDEAFLQHKEDDIESQNERLKGMGVGMEIDIGTRQAVSNFKHFSKSIEILNSALKIFTSNSKFIFLMILSILPLFALMVFYEIKLQKMIIFASSNSLLQNQRVHTIYSSHSILNNRTVVSHDDDETTYTNKGREFLFETLETSLFYLFVYPLLEFLSMSLTLKIAAKVHAPDKQTTLRELIYQKVNFKGPFVTYLCVHLLSCMTLLGLYWIVLNHFLVAGPFFRPRYFVHSIDFWEALFIALHSLMFLALLYKYLDWSACWNMGMVISFTEEETGIDALGLSDYYGKHCKKIGFHLMLGFFVFGNVLRLPCLYAGLCNGSIFGIVITSIGIELVSTGNLVKWVAFLVYFDYCKQQTFEKKDDDQELKKTVKAAGDQS